MNNNRVEQDFSALDAIGAFSVVINLMTLDKTVTTDHLTKNLSLALKDIHKHLEEQDRKIDVILNKLGGDING